MMDKTAPPSVTSQRQLAVIYLYTVLLLGMILLQLVNFEAFAQTMAIHGISDTKGGVVLAVSLLTLEIFALPFLLHLWLSGFARAISATCVLLVPALWTAVILQAVLRPDHIESIGLFGGFIAVPNDGMATAYGLLLIVLAIRSFSLLNGAKALQAR